MAEKHVYCSFIIPNGYPDGGDTTIVVTPKSYWLKEQTCDDGHADKEIFNVLNELGFYESFESFFIECDIHYSPQQVKNILNKNDLFEENNNFEKFILKEYFSN